MKIQELLQSSIQILKDNKIEEPIQIARQLLCHILKQDKVFLVVHSDTEVEKAQEEAFGEAITKITQNIPLQYITNRQEFMKMEFYVDENVLIPREDTEIVVQSAIDIINENNFTNVLDMCTGSGAIAVSIAKYTNNCNVTAVDISNKAIDIAKQNAKNNNVDIDFINSNMFENVDKKYDLIISNPPYIKTEVIQSLDKNVQKEPKIALDGGTDGLEFYKIIEEQAYKYLNKQGYLVLEIGYDQKEEVSNLLKNRYKDIVCKKDIGGNDRVIICKRR